MAAPLIPVILSGGTRHAAVADVAQAAAEAVPAAGHRAQPAAGDGAAAAPASPASPPPIVVCNEEHRFLVAEQLQASASGRTRIVLEPVGRNTAPAIAVAARVAGAAVDPDAAAARAALRPRRSPTCRRSAAVDRGAQRRARRRAGHVRHRADAARDRLRLHRSAAKPLAGRPALRASSASSRSPTRRPPQASVARAAILWNSGMFLFRGAGATSTSWSASRPDIAAGAERALAAAHADLDFLRLDDERSPPARRTRSTTR